MQTYDCNVRLANTTTSEVPKFGVTAPEIIILRKIHGLDSVVRIQARKMDNRPHASERARLQKVYGDLHPGIIEHLFGHDHVPLPIVLNAESEAEAAKAVAAAEAEQAEKDAAEKAKFDEAVKREVARLEGVRKAKAAHENNNQNDGSGSPRIEGKLSLKKA